MTNRLNFAALAVAGILLPLAMAAQDSGTTTAPSAGSVIVITGCLQNGDQINEYLLTGLDDSKWRIKVPTSMDLVTQVNHLVQVRGVLTSSAEETAELTSPPLRKLTATDFRKVDENCK